MAMGVNRPVIVGAVGITAVGVVAAVIKGKPVSGVIIGGYLIAIIGGVIDLFGDKAAKLAGSIVLLALLSTILYEADIVGRVLGIGVNYGSNATPTVPGTGGAPGVPGATGTPGNPVTGGGGAPGVK